MLYSKPLDVRSSLKTYYTTLNSCIFIYDNKSIKVEGRANSWQFIVKYCSTQNTRVNCSHLRLLSYKVTASSVSLWGNILDIYLLPNLIKSSKLGIYQPSHKNLFHESSRKWTQVLHLLRKTKVLNIKHLLTIVQLHSSVFALLNLMFIFSFLAFVTHPQWISQLFPFPLSLQFGSTMIMRAWRSLMKSKVRDSHPQGPAGFKC